MGAAAARVVSSRLLQLLVAVGLPVATVAAFSRPNGFFSDDYVNFREVQLSELNLEFLAGNTWGHFAPGHRLGDWLFYQTFGLDYPLAVVFFVVCLAATLVVFHRLLVEVHRPGVGVAVLTLIYGMSTVHFDTVTSFASAMDRLPATLLTFVSVLAYLRYYRTRSHAWLATSLAAMTLGLLFYVKPVLIPLYLVLLRTLILEPDRPVRENVRDALREWRMWLLYAAPVAAYAAVYLPRYTPIGVHEPTVGTVAEYTATVWFRVMSPGLFGLYMRDYNTTTTLVCIAVQLVLVGIVGWTLVRLRGAWRIYLFFVVAFVVNALLVALHIHYFSVRTMAFVLWYNLEPTFIVAIAVAAFMRLRTLQASRPPLPLAQGRVLVTAGVVIFVSASLIADAGYLNRPADRGDEPAFDTDALPHLSGPYARRYQSDTAAALDRLVAQYPKAALVDNVVPWYVIHPLLGPSTSYSEVLPVIDDRVKFASDGRDLALLGHNALFIPVAFVPRGGGDAVGLFQSGALSVQNATARATPRGLCVIVQSEWAKMVYVPPAPLSGAPSFVSMVYSSTTRRTLSFSSEPVGGGPNQERFVMSAEAPDHATVIDLIAPSVQKLTMTLSAGSQFCLKDIELGHLAPR